MKQLLSYRKTGFRAVRFMWMISKLTRCCPSFLQTHFQVDHRRDNPQKCLHRCHEQMSN